MFMALNTSLLPAGKKRSTGTLQLLLLVWLNITPDDILNLSDWLQICNEMGSRRRLMLLILEHMTKQRCIVRASPGQLRPLVIGRQNHIICAKLDSCTLN